MTFAYALITRSFGLAFDIFYRRQHLGGIIPGQGPVIIVANHPNALMDPTVVARLCPRPVRFLAKEPLFRMPVISWLVKGTGALPVFRAKDGHDTAKNKDMFQAVFDALQNGDLIGLFPEGIGHNASQMQPLKTGAARMALGAEAQGDWSLGVKIVPMGITFADKPSFRSDCWTEIGPALDVNEWRKAFSKDEVEAARALTAAIDEALHAVTLNLERWEDLPLVELAALLWQPATGSTAVDGATRQRLLAEAQEHLAQEDPEALLKIRSDLSALKKQLDQAGLGPEHLRQRYTPAVLMAFLLRHALAMIFAPPVVMVGALAYGLPYLFLRQVPKLLRAPPDMLATQRILGGLVILPAWHLALAVLLSFQLPTTTALALGIALPFCGLYAHAFLHRRKRMFRDAASFLHLLFRPQLRNELLQKERALSDELDRLAQLLERSAQVDRSAAAS